MTATTHDQPAPRRPSEVLQRAHRDPAYGAYLLLRVGFTVLPIWFGVDEFTNALTDWADYLAPWIVGLIPSTHTRRCSSSE